MTDRKQIAKSLDYAASNSSYPASSKQCWFLAGLIADAGETAEAIFGDICPTRRTLSSKMASTFIDQYLADRKKAA